MKTLLKLALAGAFATALIRWARQWTTAGSGEIPTVNPVLDAEPAVAEPPKGDDQLAVPKWPF